MTSEPPRTFLDAIARRLPPPPAARTLGFELVDVDPGNGTIVVAFSAGPSFTNPYGEVLGGFLAAMLYDTAGPAVLATLPAATFIVIHHLRATFLRPAGTGRIVGRGQITGRHGDQIDVAATLEDADGELLATGEAAIESVPRQPPATPASREP